MQRSKENQNGSSGRVQLNNVRGDAMIIVLCILMLFMVLSFSVLTAAGVVLGTSKKNAVSERCKTAAATFSAMMEEQLTTDREAVPLRIQTFFMDMVQSKMQTAVPESADFYWNEDSDTDEIPDSLIHHISVENGGKTMGEILNGYDISVEAVWIGGQDKFQDAWNENNSPEKTDAERLPNECCYDGIGLKVTTICSNEKFHESYRATVYYRVWIEAAPGEAAPKVWKFTPDGRTTS